MKPAPFAYIRPETIEAALEALADGDAQVLAGGQSLAPMLHMRLMRPATVVDINRIDALDRIDARGSCTAIGARTRYSRIENSALVAERLPLLQNIVRYVGDRQIRNRGTIGGSLVQADPVGEMPLACLALDATVVLRSTESTRELPVDDFILGPYTTACEPNELLVEVRFPASPGAYAFFELGRRHNDFAVLALAAAGDPEPGGAWSNLRLALAGADYRPVLVRLDASMLDDAAIDAAVEVCLEAADPPDDVRASAAYRRHLIEVHAARVLRELRDEQWILRV